MVDLFRYQHWDLVSKRGMYYVISAIMLLAGIVALFSNASRNGWGNALNFGIDFKGGGSVSYRVDGRLPEPKLSTIIGEIRGKLEADGIKRSEVQISPATGESSGDVVIVKLMLPDNTPDAQVDSVLTEQASKTITPAVSEVVKQYLPKSSEITKPEAQETVTGTVSDELLKNGVAALIIGSILILFWIWFRYNIAGFGARYGIAGIIALVHDLATLVGMFAILHNFLEVNSPFIAALLTVLGYSIHDTIVIFDRVRENIRLRKGRTFAETVNISLLETLARSVNTVLTVLFTLLALFFFGGPTLRDFVAAMLIGVTVGAYSSIFVASQLLVSWSKAQDKVMPTGDDAWVAPTLAPQPVAVASGAVAASSAPQAGPAVSPVASASHEDIQRARQAGKTSRRRR